MIKLSAQSKDELRKKVIELLKDVPDGQKIHIDKDMLESLLFEVITLNKEKNLVVKLPVWSGYFLKKIDLSQVDFTNVSWYLLDITDDMDTLGSGYGVTDEKIFNELHRLKDKNIEERLYLSDGYSVSYAGTNANIDLTKSFEAIHANYIETRKCNFTGLDFSKQDLSKIDSIFFDRSSIADTNLVIPSNIELQSDRSNLGNIDLSARTIDAGEYFWEDLWNLAISDLHNTGINITLDYETIKGYDDVRLVMVMNKYWVGCYVNGVKILSPEEKKEFATTKRSEYEQMKNEIFNSITDSIKSQIDNMKR